MGGRFSTEYSGGRRLLGARRLHSTPSSSYCNPFPGSCRTPPAAATTPAPHPAAADALLQSIRYRTGMANIRMLDTINNDLTCLVQLCVPYMHGQGTEVREHNVLHRVAHRATPT